MIVAEIIVPFLLGGIAVAGATSLLFLPPLRQIFWPSTRALVLLLGAALIVGAFGLTSNLYYLVALALLATSASILVVINARQASDAFKR
ncbi:MAG: hypothetical protein JO219_01895 [Candidatus Eremiobacteraeota bacterium]|nr:hypothetical protein [Candidatus Eremiobacteraeota bacterium]MBV8366492.1 hypothetical protein [Candidatus Eremiobacteraeota bacterium]